MKVSHFSFENFKVKKRSFSDNMLDGVATYQSKKFLIMNFSRS